MRPKWSRPSPNRFAGWNNGTPWTRITANTATSAPVNQSIETPDKENAVFLARIKPRSNQNDPDYPALYVANYILGGGAGFDSRLTASIRVKEGLSYSVGSRLSVGRFDRAGDWSVQAIAAPQNIAKVEATFSDELAKFQGGVTAEELTKAKSGIAPAGYAEARPGRSAGGRIAVPHRHRRTFAWDKAFEAKVQALTLRTCWRRRASISIRPSSPSSRPGDFAKGRRGEVADRWSKGAGTMQCPAPPKSTQVQRMSCGSSDMPARRCSSPTGCRTAHAGTPLRCGGSGRPRS